MISGLYKAKEKGGLGILSFTFSKGGSGGQVLLLSWSPVNVGKRGRNSFGNWRVSSYK